MSSRIIEHDKPLQERTYETDKSLNEYLLLHFGENLSGKFVHQSAQDSQPDQQNNEYRLDISDPLTIVHNYGDFGVFNVTSGQLEAPPFPTYALNFPARVAQMALYWYKHLHPQSSGADTIAFDLGCAVGRTAFELSPFFSQVDALDYSHAFILAGQRLAKGEKLTYSVPIEGNVRFQAVAALEEHIVPSRLNFFQGDACTLPTNQQYDCITAANLIDRLPNPRAFLNSLQNIVKVGGLVVLTSPYTWLAEYTPEDQWLVNDQRSTFEHLQDILGGSFKLVHQSHMPFFIRETARKSQFTFAHCTVWQRL